VTYAAVVMGWAWMTSWQAAQTTRVLRRLVAMSVAHAGLAWLDRSQVGQFADRLAVAKGSEGASHKAFFNRWPTKNEFLPDAVVYALLREHEADDPQEYIEAYQKVVLKK
jgi:hypothetical protein